MPCRHAVQLRPPPGGSATLPGSAVGWRAAGVFLTTIPGSSMTLCSDMFVVSVWHFLGTTFR